MKYLLAITSLMISVSALAQNDNGQCIPGFTGCFNYGPEVDCNPLLDPPTINTCGFQYGGAENQAAVFHVTPQVGSKIAGTFLVQEKKADCYYNANTINSQKAPQPGLVVILAKETGVSICNPVVDGDECAQEMKVGKSSKNGISGIYDTQDGHYASGSFYYSYEFFAAPADTTPESSTSATIVPDASGNVVMTFTTFETPNTSTQACHLIRIND